MTHKELKGKVRLRERLLRNLAQPLTDAALFPDSADDPVVSEVMPPHSQIEKNECDTTNGL